MFRGREVTHPERGTAILDRLAEELAELGVVEQRPMQEGRNMTMMLAPSKAVLAGRTDVGEARRDEAPPTARTSATSPPTAIELAAERGARRRRRRRGRRRRARRSGAGRAPSRRRRAPAADAPSEPSRRGAEPPPQAPRRAPADAAAAAAAVP